jgi:hypothetical protein
MRVLNTITRTRQSCRASTLAAGFWVVVISASAAKAGPLFVFVVQDPTYTAGAGVAPVSGMTVTSTRSGTGTWHLYAVDDGTTTFGIRNYSITLAGASAINHRSPFGSYIDENGDTQAVGFNDLRSGTNVNPIVAGQGLVNPTRIGGLGQTAGDFPSKISNEQSVSQTSSGQWGLYADIPAVPIISGPGASGQVRNALFIAEGTGSPSVTSASVSLWTSPDLSSSAFATSYSNVMPCFCSPSPPTVQNAVINNVAADNPGSVTHTFSAYGSSTITWSDFQFESYTPAFGGSGTGPASPATFDPSTRQFVWNSVGSPIGIYKWTVTAANFLGSDQGTLTVNVTVPEPATALLVGLAAIGLGGYRRRG